MKPGDADAHTVELEGAPALEHADRGFYRAFEEQFRGSRPDIKQRLSAYLPFILPLQETLQPACALDLGCGRGEWLELLIEHGFEAVGVDLDAGMLQACLELGLPAAQADAIAHLRSSASESLAIVSGFHVAEHLQFAELQILIEQAHRVLLPGGLLILETPNPENLVVATSSFYTDPTHQRPLPPALLSFLTQHYGFSRCKTVRLQESPELAARQQVSLMEVFAGVSPDYAVVAQKSASADVLQSFAPAFEREYGLDLQQLAGRHDAGDRARVQYLEPQLALAQASVDALIVHLQNVETRRDEAEHRTSEAKRQAGDAQHSMEVAQKQLSMLKIELEAQRNDLTRHVEKALDDAQRWQRQYQAAMTSTSWRITWPLRSLKEASIGLREMLFRLFKWPVVWCARVTLKALSRYPSIRAGASRASKRFPRLNAHAAAFARSRGLIPPIETASVDEARRVEATLGTSPAGTRSIPRRRGTGMNRDQMSPLEKAVTDEDRP